MDETLSKDFGCDPFVMAGGNWDRDLKREDERSENRTRGVWMYTDPDLSQLEDERAGCDWSHDLDVRANGWEQSEWR